MVGPIQVSCPTLFAHGFLQPMDLTVDFRGQKLAEELYQVVIVAFSVVAFVTGYSQRRVVTGASLAVPLTPATAPSA